MGGREVREEERTRTHFCFWRTKTKNIFLGGERVHELSWASARGRQREPKNSRLAYLPSSRPPVKSGPRADGLESEWPEAVLRAVLADRCASGCLRAVCSW